MKSKSNFVSSCVVALLAGLIYYFLNQPADTKISKDNLNLTGSKTTLAENTDDITSQKAKGEKEIVTPENDKVQQDNLTKTYSWKNNEVKLRMNGNISKGVKWIANNPSKSDKNQMMNVYASNLLANLDDEDMLVSVFSDGKDTHIIVQDKDCQVSKMKDKGKEKNKKITTSINPNVEITEGEDCEYMITLKGYVNNSEQYVVSKNKTKTNQVISPEVTKEPKLKVGDDNTGTSY